MVLQRELSKLSPELIFVLSCANDGDKHKTSALLALNLDWEIVLRLSLSNGLFPLVYNTLINLDKSQVPESVIKTLKHYFFINALKITSQNKEIIRIVLSLDEHGIQPIILKGSPLSVKINEDITYRPSNDIDILVDPLEFDKTEKILEQIGYKRYSPDFKLTPRQQKTYLEIHHHFEYYHSQRAIFLELHWKIRSFNVKKFPTASNLGTQKINISECPITVMDNEHWLLFLMIHGYKHFWHRLRWLYDILEFLKLKIDWQKLIYLADKFESMVILHQSLILANRLFDVPVPVCLEQSLTTDKKAFKLANTVINNLRKSENKKNYSKHTIKKMFYDYNYSNYTIKNKLNHLLLLTKPSLVEFKIISLPDILFPCYYIIRPVYWLGKQIKAQTKK